MGKLKGKAIFLDRDGTINEEVGYLDSLEKLVLYPQAFTAMRMINQSGFKAVVVTNQSGVARGYFTEELVVLVHARIQDLMRENDASIDAFFYCPHHPDAGGELYRKPCSCRKPEAGMFLQAAGVLNIDLGQSFMIGDTMRDMEAALRAGMRGILVRTGYGKEAENELHNAAVKPVHIADNILEAVRWIIRRE